MEQCSQLLLLFYRKVIVQHPHKTTLIRRLHSLLKQSQMTQQHAQDPPTHRSRRENQNTLPDKLTEAEISTLKGAGEEWGLECTFVAHSFLQNMLFAVLNRFIELEDFIGFKCLEEKLNMRLQESNLAEETMRIISYEWFRMGQILVNKKRLRWQKLLSETVHSMPVQFDALFGQICEGDGEQAGHNEPILAKISKLAKAKIVYCQLQGRRMLNRQVFGMGQAEIHVCFLHDLNKHLVCSKPPQQAPAIKLKQQALNEMRLAFDSLMQQYEQDTANMSSLSNLSDLRLNEWKVTAYLGKK